MYSSVEHAFQAAKTLDVETRRTIKNLDTPALAKQKGHIVELRTDWENIKYTIMEDLVRRKFSDMCLSQKLLATLPHFLIEGNIWHDNIWGICYCQQCQGKNGFNYLGKILMKVREERFDLMIRKEK